MNIKVRIKNPMFWAHVAIAFFAPILVHAGINFDQVSSWPMLFALMAEAFSSPALVVSIIVSVWNFLVDPTTTGVTDSALAKSYDSPKSDN